MAPTVAVLLPCYNEEVAIGEIVRGFRAALPDATVYVYDNNSTDHTVTRAAEAGAVVRLEPLQGKGNVVRRMFADIEADIYVLADGDGTYDPKNAPAMIDRLTSSNLDMVVGARLAAAGDEAFRTGHRAGNRLLSGLVAALLPNRLTDMLSGYRVFSRRFVKSFPALARGFETETELTIHALELRMPVAEVAIPYAARPGGSASKLSTWRDGTRILATVMFLFKEARPFKFFASIAAILAALALGLAAPLVETYIRTGLVPRLPTAVLITGIMIVATMSFMCGVILDTVSRGRREAKRMRYLEIPSIAAAVADDRPAVTAPPAPHGASPISLERR
jgi:glycosyltransferase involved in cell wall biosynthesis